MNDIDATRTGPAFRALEQYAQGALDFVVHTAVALLLGLLVARLMRRHHLHWSWAAAGLATTWVLRSVLGGFAYETIVLLATAAHCGRRWHIQDLDTGSDLAGIARARHSPIAALRRAAVRAGATFPALLSRGPGAGELTVGRESDGRPVTVPFAAESATHTLVVGATGSGKTVTQTLMAVRAIEAGRAAIVIDPKGDSRMRDHLGRAAGRAGRELIEWTPVGPSIYNPYGRGAETEIADRLLAGERFTEPHYLRQAQRYLGHVVRALRAEGTEVTLASIVALLEPEALELLLRDLPEPQARVGHAYLDSLTPRQQRDLAGVRDRLAILTESEVGRWLDPSSGAARRFDLLAAVWDRAVVYFNLEADGRPLLARMLGAAIVQDLQSTVAALQGSPTPALVVIDEFSALAAEQVVALFGRARSAGFSLLLGTQELADLRLPGNERLLEQVMGNLSLLIAHRQVVPASAELVARLGGSRGSWRVAWSSDGRTTRTRSEEPLLAPDTMMGLAPGWGAVIPFGRRSGARLARITPAGGEL
ncbi:MAG: helicase HerA-like domain-containing protein [Solirubrobacteraceae bacterium]